MCCVGCRLFGSLPARAAIAARNLHAVVGHLAEQISRAAVALRSSGETMLTEEDVITVSTLAAGHGRCSHSGCVVLAQMVTEDRPWKHVTPADRFIDSYTPFVEGQSGDTATIGALTRGIVEDCRFAVKL